MKESQKVDNKEPSIWSEGYFAETLDPLDMKAKMRTFHIFQRIENGQR